MGKTCLNKLTSGFLASCGIPLHGVSEALLVYGSDVGTFEVTDGVVTSADVLSGAFCYVVEGIKNSIQATQALLTGDYNNGIRQTISFYAYDKAESHLMVRGVLNGKFVVFLKMKEAGIYKVFGTYVNLEVSAVEEDSNANGAFTRITLSTPEGSVGDQYISTSASVYNSLKSKSK